MTYRGFDVASDNDIHDVLGIRPEAVPGEEPWVRRLQAQDATGLVLTLTYDAIALSVALSLARDGVVVYEFFREGGVRLVARAERGQAELVVSFETDGLAGELVILVGERIHAKDVLLLK